MGISNPHAGPESPAPGATSAQPPDDSSQNVSPDEAPLSADELEIYDFRIGEYRARDELELSFMDGGFDLAFG